MRVRMERPLQLGHIALRLSVEAELYDVAYRVVVIDQRLGGCSHIGQY
jgi:hypothetical protein